MQCRLACCSGVRTALWRSSSILRQGTFANLRLAPFHSCGCTSCGAITRTTSFCPQAHTLSQTSASG